MSAGGMLQRPRHLKVVSCCLSDSLCHDACMHQSCAVCSLQENLGSELDVRRVGLWGTSFAGGHVLVTAAKEGTNISAVVSQVGHPYTPMYDIPFAAWRHACIALFPASETRHASFALQQWGACMHCTSHSIRSSGGPELRSMHVPSLHAGTTFEWHRGIQAEPQEEGGAPERAPVPCRPA